MLCYSLAREDDGDIRARARRAGLPRLHLNRLALHSAIHANNAPWISSCTTPCTLAQEDDKDIREEGLESPTSRLPPPYKMHAFQPCSNTVLLSACAPCTLAQEDDKDIREEGLESLTEDELRQACRARGMRAPYGEGSAAFMRQQLTEWLDWSLDRCAWGLCFLCGWVGGG